MPKAPLKSPPSDAEIKVVVDWLELQAFFSEFDIARLDDAISVDLFQQDEEELEFDDKDIGQTDAAQEDSRAKIEAEINIRQSALGHSYPFDLDGQGEEITIRREHNNHPSMAYLLCLVLSHVTRSAILDSPPNGEMVREARKRLFQIVATIAAAGVSGGGAVSLGWPREKRETILAVVARAVALSGVGAARQQPYHLEPAAAKDGGLDVLSWTPMPDGPPPSNFWFVQAASGHNWIEKSSRNEITSFLNCYFAPPPESNHDWMTICPFRLDEDTKTYQQANHGTIVDRTRLPAAVARALESAANGNDAIDEINNYPKVGLWINAYKKFGLVAD
jgi:hypothetical protein